MRRAPGGAWNCSGAGRISAKIDSSASDERSSGESWSSEADVRSDSSIQASLNLCCGDDLCCSAPGACLKLFRVARRCSGDKDGVRCATSSSRRNRREMGERRNTGFARCPVRRGQNGECAVTAAGEAWSALGVRPGLGHGSKRRRAAGDSALVRGYMASVRAMRRLRAP